VLLLAECLPVSHDSVGVPCLIAGNAGGALKGGQIIDAKGASNRSLLRTLLTIGTPSEPPRPSGRLSRPEPAGTPVAAGPTRAEAGGRGGASAPAGTDLARALEALRRPQRRRGLVVVVSDFLSVDLSWERPLRALAGRHDVLAIEVIDPLELALPNVGPLAVVDPETGALFELPTHSRRFRARYEQAAARHRDDVAAALRAAGASHLRLRTDTDWLVEIARYAAAHRRGQAALRAAGPRAAAGQTRAGRPGRAGQGAPPPGRGLPEHRPGRPGGSAIRTGGAS